MRCCLKLGGQEVTFLHTFSSGSFFICAQTSYFGLSPGFLSSYESSLMHDELCNLMFMWGDNFWRVLLQPHLALPF